MSQLSQAIVSAIHTSHPQCKHLQYILSGLARIENHPSWLTQRAYEWCSVICENYQLADGQKPLFLSLEIGFRHFDDPWLRLTHTEHHHKIADIVFVSGDNEAIADLLVAWTSGYAHSGLHGPLNICVRHFIHLHKLQPLPSRLQQLIIHSIAIIGYEEFKEVEAEAFFAMLNDLHVDAKDVGHVGHKWASLLLDVILSPEATQHLSHHYWHLLVELVIFHASWIEPPTYNPQIITFLKDAQEWDKLECWVGVVWMLWPPEDNETMEKHLECEMLSLFHQQPGAVQRLEQWIKQWGKNTGWDVPELFGQICEGAHFETAQQDTG